MEIHVFVADFQLLVQNRSSKWFKIAILYGNSCVLSRFSTIDAEIDRQNGSESLILLGIIAHFFDLGDIFTV